jgi:hypothetical protein
MMTAFRHIKTILRWALLCAVFSACGGSPAPAPVVPPVSLVPPDELDAAIREASDYLNRQLPAGNKLVILNIQSEFPALSEYIIDELIANTVNDRFFTAVDRQQLALIRAELDFQMSGDVDDETAQALGRMAGAQTIISGAVSRIGSLYRLRVRALSVQNAQIEGQFNRNIPDGPVISILAKSEATGYGGEANYGGAAQPGTAASGGEAAATSTAVGSAGSGSSIGSAGSPPAVGPAPTLVVTPTAAPTSSATPPPSIRKPNQGTELADGVWTTGSIRTSAVLYYFYAEEAAAYQVYWDGRVTTESNANIIVSAYWHNNGTRQKIFENDSGRALKGFQGKSIIGKKFDYIIVEVKPYGSSGGNFRIRFDKFVSPSTPAWVAGASNPGLYVNGAFHGQMELLDALDWITLNATGSGYYLVVLGQDEKIPYARLDFKGLKVTVSLKGAERERKIEYDSASPPQPMFTILPGVTFVLEDGVALSGLNANSHPLVSVEGGALVMNGGAVRNNSVNNVSSGNVGGSGVRVQNGSFFMNNGTISGNSASSTRYGGGVYIIRGSVAIMRGGTISGNSASNSGGGVYCTDVFIMKGGIISGNSAREDGGGVYSFSGTFFKFGNGGVIYGSNAPEDQANTARSGAAVYGAGRRNTTARATTMLDSDIRGAQGGWE